MESPKGIRMRGILLETNKHKIGDGGFKEKASRSSCCFSFDHQPKSPIEAMDFLSRTWSPSSFDFNQILYLNTKKALLPCEEQLLEMKCEPMENVKYGSGNGYSKVDDTWTCLSKGKSAASTRHHWAYLGNLKSWFSRDGIISYSKGRKQRRKDVIRQQKTEIDAALSVTQIAAAIAGVIANANLHENKEVYTNTTSKECRNMRMSQALASAAVLVATVCAEAAEMVGARRSHIASAIQFGLTTHNPSDMVAATANAATCLRGVAALKMRTKTMYGFKDKEALAKGTQLPVLVPSGKIQVLVVSIYSKKGMLWLKLGKKYIHGAITRYKDYGIIQMIKHMRDGGCLFKHVSGVCLLIVETTGGTIQVLFDDELQCKTLATSISQFLYDGNRSC